MGCRFSKSPHSASARALLGQTHSWLRTVPSATFSGRPLANAVFAGISASLEEFCQVISAGCRVVAEPEELSQGHADMACCALRTCCPEDTWPACSSGTCWRPRPNRVKKYGTCSTWFSKIDCLRLFLFVLIQLSHCHSQLADWVLEATTRKSLLGMQKEPSDLSESGEGRWFSKEECIGDKIF